MLLAPFTSIKSLLNDYHIVGVFPVLQPLQSFPSIRGTVFLFSSPLISVKHFSRVYHDTLLEYALQHFSCHFCGSTLILVLRALAKRMCRESTRPSLSRTRKTTLISPIRTHKTSSTYFSTRSSRSFPKRQSSRPNTRTSIGTPTVQPSRSATSAEASYCTPRTSPASAQFRASRERLRRVRSRQRWCTWKHCGEGMTVLVCSRRLSTSLALSSSPARLDVCLMDAYRVKLYIQYSVINAYRVSTFLPFLFCTLSSSVLAVCRDDLPRWRVLPTHRYTP